MSEVQWGSVADWAAAGASFLASVTALYLARASTRVRIKGYFGLRSVVGNGGPQRKIVMLQVTNEGTRSTRVLTISLHTGAWRKKRQAVIPDWPSAFSDPLPKVLADGENGTWAIELDAQDSWIKEVAVGFLRTHANVDRFTMQVHTSNARSLSIKPEKSLLDRMHDFLKKEGEQPEQRPDD